MGKKSRRKQQRKNGKQAVSVAKKAQIRTSAQTTSANNAVSSVAHPNTQAEDNRNTEPLPIQQAETKPETTAQPLAAVTPVAEDFAKLMHNKNDVKAAPATVSSANPPPILVESAHDVSTDVSTSTISSDGSLRSAKVGGEGEGEEVAAAVVANAESNEAEKERHNPWSVAEKDNAEADDITEKEDESLRAVKVGGEEGASNVVVNTKSNGAEKERQDAGSVAERDNAETVDATDDIKEKEDESLRSEKVGEEAGTASVIVNTTTADTETERQDPEPPTENEDAGEAEVVDNSVEKEDTLLQSVKVGAEEGAAATVIPDSNHTENTCQDPGSSAEKQGAGTADVVDEIEEKEDKLLAAALEREDDYTATATVIPESNRTENTCQDPESPVEKDGAGTVEVLAEIEEKKDKLLASSMEREDDCTAAATVESNRMENTGDDPESPAEKEGTGTVEAVGGIEETEDKSPHVTKLKEEDSLVAVTDTEPHNKETQCLDTDFSVPKEKDAKAVEAVDENVETREDNDFSDQSSEGSSVEEDSVDVPPVDLSSGPVILSEPDLFSNIADATRDQPPSVAADMFDGGADEQVGLLIDGDDDGTGAASVEVPAPSPISTKAKKAFDVVEVLSPNPDDTTFVSAYCEFPQVVESSNQAPKNEVPEGDKAMKDLDDLLRDSSDNEGLGAKEDDGEAFGINDGLLPEEDEPLVDHFWAEPSVILPDDLNKLPSIIDQSPQAMVRSKAAELLRTRPTLDTPETETTKTDQTQPVMPSQGALGMKTEESQTAVYPKPEPTHDEGDPSSHESFTDVELLTKRLNEVEALTKRLKEEADDQHQPEPEPATEPEPEPATEPEPEPEPPAVTMKRESSSGFLEQVFGTNASEEPKMSHSDGLTSSNENLSELNRLLQEAESKRAAEPFGSVSPSVEDGFETETDDEFVTEEEVETKPVAVKNRPRLYARNKCVDDMTFSQEIRNETIRALDQDDSMQKQKVDVAKDLETKAREKLEKELGTWNDMPKKETAVGSKQAMKQRMREIEQKTKTIDENSKRDSDADTSNHSALDDPEVEAEQFKKQMVRRRLRELEQAMGAVQNSPAASPSAVSPSAASPSAASANSKMPNSPEDVAPRAVPRSSSARLEQLREKVRAKENSVKTLVRKNSDRNLNRQRVERNKQDESDSSDSDEPKLAPPKKTMSNGSGHRRRGQLQRQPSVKGMRRQRSFRMSRKGSSRKLQSTPHRNSKSPLPAVADQRRVHLPTSMRQAVVESWKIVEGKLDELGMDFFLTLFQQNPQMKDLFHFGGVPTEELHKSKMLQAHATGVMKTVGVALAGLSDMESLIPVLRNLGRIHTMVGVQPHYYDLIYTVLIDTIAKYVGPEKWTTETQEAWELCYTAITAVMKDPSRHLDVEPAEGWGMWQAGTCAFLALTTPLQLADFGRVWFMQVIFSLLNTAALVTCLMDLGSDVLQSVIQLKTRSEYKNANRRWFFLKFKITRIIRMLGLSRWASWPTLDAAVISSFVLQGILGWWSGVPRSIYYIVGLVRVSAVLRTVHFFRCLELVSLKSSDITMERFHYGQLAQLFLVLVYMIHLFGCLHCMVSKLSDHTETSTFSPALFNLLKSGSMVNAYLHTTYWAFVNVAGIGSYDSVPETSLEILFSMLVHLVGATLYTSAASYIFAILESRAKAFSAVREGVASLKDFMHDCNIPPTSQEAFVSGYLMRNYISQRNKKQKSRESQATRPLLPEAAEALPTHLTSELTVFSRAKAIRNRGIKTASVEFSFVLAESLNEKITLLSGDYLFQEGDEVTRHVWMVDKGKLEVFVDGVSKKCLYPGDIVGLGWLATDSADPRESARHKAYLDWVSLGSIAIADIRAMDACQLVMGLEHNSQVADLRRLYATDMARIRDQCEKEEDTEGHQTPERRLTAV